MNSLLLPVHIIFPVCIRFFFFRIDNSTNILNFQLQALPFYTIKLACIHKHTMGSGFPSNKFTNTFPYIAQRHLGAYGLLDFFFVFWFLLLVKCLRFIVDNTTHTHHTKKRRKKLIQCGFFFTATTMWTHRFLKSEKIKNLSSPI